VAPTKASTLYDVAKVAGVSHQTVSRLLRGHTGIREETRARVLDAIKQLDYHPNITARNLRNGSTGMIALAIPDLRQPYFAELAQSVIGAARDAGLTVFVETTDGNPARELAVLGGMQSQLVDGVLYIPKSIDADILTAQNIDFPIVLLGDRILNSQFDHVTLPNLDGAQAAVQHLISLGRTRVAFVGAEPDTDFGAAALRLRGYRNALEAAGITYRHDLVMFDSEWERHSGASSMKALLDSGAPFDSVFCCNDALAIGALRTLLSAGLRVPDDVAIAGFDDTEDARFSFPSLTSVSPGRDELARAAVGLLQRRIDEGGACGAREEIVTGYSLAIRESTVGAR
jgi:DNA-binding LacI/PurR family transcriptional regulator